MLGYLYERNDTKRVQATRSESTLEGYYREGTERFYEASGAPAQVQTRKRRCKVKRFRVTHSFGIKSC